METAYITLADAARRVGCSRQRIHQLVKEGRLAAITRHHRRYVLLWSLDHLAERGFKGGRIFRQPTIWDRTRPGRNAKP